MTDLRASKGDDKAGLGPIGQAVRARKFDHVVLLTDLKKTEVNSYIKWLGGLTDADINPIQQKLTSPTNFGEIHSGAVKAIESLGDLSQHQLCFHISPGTPAMAAVWIILAKTRFAAELIESSQQHGVKTVDVPFDMSAEFLPSLLRGAESEFEKMSDEIAADASTFDDIVFNSPQMTEVVNLARRLALFDAPVLVEGESGTGKELFARAIYRGSARHAGPFIAVNCGAIPAELVESELFGHEKGSFTGASAKRIGKFVEANKGTIFLDEIGELPLQAQVKLLRVLQEKEVTPIGTNKPQKIDVRVVSATNRSLVDEIAQRNFREDLFYRLAVFTLNIPPVRERSGDISLLIKHILDELNHQNVGKFWKDEKVIKPAARNILLKHTWPGNVRELQSTLLRAAIFSQGNNIDLADVERAIQAPVSRNTSTTFAPITDGFDLQEYLANTARHYLRSALDASGGNKSKASRMLGLPNYQTFLNWARKYGVG